MLCPLLIAQFSIIIDSNGVKTDFYMGVRSLDENRTISSLKNTVENAMKGQFPGIKTFDDYTVEDMEAILDKIKAKSISAVSCVANNKSHEQTSNQSFVQGLEKLVLSMQGEKYTGIIIAMVHHKPSYGNYARDMKLFILSFLPLLPHR